MDQAEKIKKETIEKGGVLAKFYFDVHSNQKDILKNLMLDFISNNILKEPGVVYAYGIIDEPIENKGLFSTNAEITILASGIMPLFNIALKYSPFSVEILEPYERKLTASEFQEILLRASETSFQLSQYIYENILTPQQKEEFNKKVINRAELAKKYLGGDKAQEKQ